MNNPMIQPATPSGGTIPPRDVGPDRWGFVYRQFADGTILVLRAPVEGALGSWIPDTRGGDLEGRVLHPGETLWAKVTAQIGEHPIQAQLRARVQQFYSHELHPTYGGARRAGYGAPPAGQTIQDILTGFSAEPQGNAGEFTATVVGALPGIQAAVYQLATPQTLEGMSKRLGKLKGDLAVTKDPRKRAQLQEQISALQYKIDVLKQKMGIPTTPPDEQGSIPWWPFAILGGLLVVGGAVVASRRGGGR